MESENSLEEKLQAPKLVHVPEDEILVSQPRQPAVHADFRSDNATDIVAVDSFDEIQPTECGPARKIRRTDNAQESYRSILSRLISTVSSVFRSDKKESSVQKTSKDTKTKETDSNGSPKQRIVW